MTENKKCETCGYDTFQVKEVFSKSVLGFEILMCVLYTCAVC